MFRPADDIGGMDDEIFKKPWDDALLEGDEDEIVVTPSNGNRALDQPIPRETDVMTTAAEIAKIAVDEIPVVRHIPYLRGILIHKSRWCMWTN